MNRPYFLQVLQTERHLSGHFKGSKNTIAEPESEVNSEEAEDVKYDDNSDGRIVLDGAETLMI